MAHFHRPTVVLSANAKTSGPRASCTWHNYQFEPRASGWLMLPTTLQCSPPKINAANDKIPSPLSSCCSWALFRRSSSRRSRGRCISSPWAKDCPRRCSRPGHARTASGKHSPSPSWVRMKSSSRDFFFFFFLGHSKYPLKLKLKAELGKRLICLLAGELDETINNIESDANLLIRVPERE